MMAAPRTRLNRISRPSAEILQMAGFEKGVKTERVDVAPIKLEPGSVEINDLQQKG
jgi:hypothetical protein